MTEQVSQGDILSGLYAELEPLKSRLSALTQLIIDQDISRYPIVVLHRETIPDVGVSVPLGDGFSWEARLSFLEDFVNKGLIKEEKVEEFIKVYKNQKTHSCIFLVSPLGANFVFYPC